MHAYLNFEARRMRRDIRLLLFAVVTPVISYVVFSSVGAAGPSPEQQAALMIGLAGYGAVFGALSVGVSVSQERASGWLRQLRATPLPPARVITVRAFLSTLAAIPPVLAVGLTGRIEHGIALSPGRSLVIVALMWLGTVPFALLGMAIGYGLTPQIAQPATFLFFFVLSVVGGLLIPTAAFPHLIQNIAQGLPTFRYAELGWRSVAGLTPNIADVAILAGWAALFGVAAVAAYRRFASLR